MPIRQRSPSASEADRTGALPGSVALVAVLVLAGCGGGGLPPAENAGPRNGEGGAEAAPSAGPAAAPDGSGAAGGSSVGQGTTSAQTPGAAGPGADSGERNPSAGDDGADVDPNDPTARRGSRVQGRTLSRHLALGIPSGASQSERTDYLMIKSQFALSYNDVARTANWVSWEVVDSDLGSVARTNDFRHDSMLPADFHVVTVADYAGSGFDRGHLCPSADRTRTRADNSATFVFTNIIPQDRAGNRGPWANFENETRRYVRAGKAVHVVAGVVNAGALGTIGSGVFVPESVFKVAVVLERGQTAADVTTTTTVIALLLPNRRGSVGERDDWATYRVPVRTIEALTRMDFLADVPKRVQDVIER